MRNVDVSMASRSWSGRFTCAGALLVAAALAPGCGNGGTHDGSSYRSAISGELCVPDEVTLDEVTGCDQASCCCEDGVEDEAPPVDGQLVCEKGSTAAIAVSFDCTVVRVQSCKDLSNVVLELADGSHQKFDGLSGHTGEFAGSDCNEGQEIVGVWVKSGANSSGDGPGYGQRFDAPADSCDIADDAGADPPTSPEPTNEGGDSSNSDPSPEPQPPITLY